MYECSFTRIILAISNNRIVIEQKYKAPAFKADISCHEPGFNHVSIVLEKEEKVTLSFEAERFPSWGAKGTVKISFKSKDSPQIYNLLTEKQNSLAHGNST